jgi:hypothetical protein
LRPIDTAGASTPGKQAEFNRFNADVSDWEQREYFSLFLGGVPP